ncbi:VOC family protein [Streptomyces sp. NBRC 110028]|uniref:VOC family protein n=1 Tax=Streptomyces sp. NBRC 110028 TaxID=1621260 RepID=UPI00351CA18C
MTCRSYGVSQRTGGQGGASRPLRERTFRARHASKTRSAGAGSPHRSLYERLSAAGVEIIREIADQPYGSREFAIADPVGDKWSFGTYRGEPRPAG